MVMEQGSSHPASIADTHRAPSLARPHAVSASSMLAATLMVGTQQCMQGAAVAFVACSIDSGGIDSGAIDSGVHYAASKSSLQLIGTAHVLIAKHWKALCN